MDFCTSCGKRLIDGACPEHGGVSVPSRREAGTPRGRLITGALTILAVVVAIAVVAAFLFLSGGIDRQARAIEALQGQLRSMHTQLNDQSLLVTGLSERLRAVEQMIDAAADPAEIADQALRSVFTIRVPSGQGSGFVVYSSGNRSTVVTNYHVVENVWISGSRQVTLLQGDRSFNGTVTDISQTEDLAAIEVRAKLVPLELTRVDPHPGDTVVAIGSPSGLQGSVSTGVVSAIRPGQLQFTAPVSPGSSGGPVLDIQGRVLGVVARKVAGIGYEGLSFAIPTSSVCSTVIRC